MKTLDGKIALVTGGGTGIGRAVALMLAAEGARVAVVGRRKAPLEEVVAQIERDKGTAVAKTCDLTRSAEARALGAWAVQTLGGVDILINNAGVFPRSPFLELTEAEWDHVLNVNLKGSFLVAQSVARKMVANGTKGAIVNISSSSVRGHVLGVHYSASKNGVIGITRSMALALAPHGIRVNALAPGITDTAQPRYQFSEAEMAEQSRLVPLGRIADPGDIASIVVFLASDDACFMTGEIIHANGGLYMA